MVMIWIITTSEKFANNVTKPQLQADHLKTHSRQATVSLFPLLLCKPVFRFRFFSSPAMTAKFISCFSTPKALCPVHILQ